LVDGDSGRLSLLKAPHYSEKSLRYADYGSDVDDSSHERQHSVLMKRLEKTELDPQNSMQRVSRVTSLPERVD